jgi:methylmalonyl-CoA/ethylmalonyl-CoA epimerase
MIVRLSHVHHAVNSMQDALKLYNDLWGLSPAKVVHFPDEGVSNALLPIGQNYIVVQEPSDPQGMLAKYIERRGEGVRSVCLVSDDLEAETRNLRAKGIEFLERSPTPSSPFRAAWINPRYTKGILVMLAQDPEIRDFMQKSYL